MTLVIKNHSPKDFASDAMDKDRQKGQKTKGCI